MSAEASGDCWRNSPFRERGEVAQMLVHLAIADVVNDVYDWRFWMKQDELAAKAMASVRSTARALAMLLEKGWLTVITPGGGRGNPTEYRYHLGGNHATMAGFTGETLPSDAVNPARKRTRTTSIPREPNAQFLDDGPADAGFEDWWKGYPRRIDKARARSAFTARRREGATLAALTQARDGYAAVVLDTDEKFIKHAATFLAPEGPWTEHLNGPPGVVEDPGSVTQQLGRAQWGAGKGAHNDDDHATGHAPRTGTGTAP